MCLILNTDYSKMPRVSTDVLIIGSGVAGLYSALNLNPNLKCIVINKAGPEKANSMYAQGGIAAVIKPNIYDDNTDSHYDDTIEAGAGMCDEAAVRVLVDEAWDNVKSLTSLGISFDEKEGRFLLTREGGHSENRILHAGGDATGFHMTTGLLRAAKKRENIKIIDNLFLTDILKDSEGKTAGAVVIDKKNKPTIYEASKIIIASGGIGRVYRNSTNAECDTGDGIAAAYRAGAILKDMEFVQFHPTAFVHPDNTGRYFLISEALRGEGAVLRNRKWYPFMKNVHPRADLAPRDIVSRAIIAEMKESNIPHVYLDITFKSRDFLKNRFPTIYNECMARGVDIVTDWIPVLPVQHYFMGGIKTDLFGRTNIPGLYSCGEASCTGVHGANRLASNSLLECLVFGRRCAQDINSSNISPPGEPLLNNSEILKDKDLDFISYSTEIRKIATTKCGIVRNRKDLLWAKKRLTEINEFLGTLSITNRKDLETYNQSQIALLIVNACLKRKKSVGAHFLSD